MSARSNKRTLLGLAGVGLFMVSMSFAAVPLYDLFCRVTGFGGTVQQADKGADKVLDREVTVRFMANTDRGMPWEFKPVLNSMKVKVGETGLAFYEATNPTDRPVAGTANFNVTPYSVSGYFTRIDCFCFTEQVLAPGETVQMPVTFFVDPEIVNDDEANLVHTITLSYTFHETDLPEKAASFDGADDKSRIAAN